MMAEFPFGWTKITLREAATELFTDGDWVESKDQDPNGEVRLIQLADIGDGIFLDKSSRFLTTDKARELKCTFLQRGDLLVARMADPIGRCCLFPGVDQPAATVVDVCIIRSGPNVDQAFLSYAISSSDFRTQILASSSGTTRNRVSRSNLGNLELLLPPLNEQRKIAEVMRSLDDTILAADKVAAQARVAFNALISELYHQFSKNSAPLASFCHDKGLQTGPFGSQLMASDYLDHGIPVIMPVDLHSDGISFTGAKTTSRQKYESLSQHALRDGDILFARRGDIGRCGIYLSTDPDAICGTGCLRARIDAAKADPLLIYFLIQCAKAKNWLKQHAVGVTMPNLNTSIIGALPLPNVPRHEQQAWIDALLMLEASCRVNEQQPARLESLKGALAKEFFSGRLRVEAESTDTDSNQRAVQPAFKRAVLAAEVVHQLHKDAKFGSVKHEKIVHLCEHQADLHHDIDRHAYKKAAGPYDPKARRSVEANFKSHKWFDVKKAQGGRTEYIPMEKCGGHKEYFDRYFAAQRETIQAVIDLLRPLDSQRCEIIATLYAVWNDYLLDGVSPTDSQIVNGARNNWHASKQAIPEDRWAKALIWMRKMQLVPRGTGEKTRVATA